jgi:hypothetical protein
VTSISWDYLFTFGTNNGRVCCSDDCVTKGALHVVFVLHVKQIMNEREMKKKQSNKNNIHLGSFQGSDLQVLESKVYSGTSLLLVPIFQNKLMNYSLKSAINMMTTA